MARGEEPVDGLKVAFDILRLVKHLLVPVEAEPLHAVEKNGDGLGRGTLEVCILHTQQELPARVPCEQPVVDGRADVADMNLARGRRRETNSDF